MSAHIIMPHEYSPYSNGYHQLEEFGLKEILVLYAPKNTYSGIILEITYAIPHLKSRLADYTLSLSTLF
jgi:hypothetical protein